MKDRSFEDQIIEVLDIRARSCSVTSDQSRRILSKIHDIAKEEQNMRHFTMRKIMAAAAAICIMASITAVAAGKIAGYRTGSDPSNPTYTQYSDVKKAEDRLGVPIRSVEQFTNGASFVNGDLRTVVATDEAGSEVGSFQSLSMYYDLSGKNIVLEISKPLETPEDRTADKVVSFEGKELKYYADQYLFLPPDVSPTEEESALETAGKLNISYGSSEVERKTFHSVQWSAGEGHYMLFSWDHDDTILVDMAKEVMSAQ